MMVFYLLASRQQINLLVYYWRISSRNFTIVKSNKSSRVFFTIYTEDTMQSNTNLSIILDNAGNNNRSPLFSKGQTVLWKAKTRCRHWCNLFFFLCMLLSYGFSQFIDFSIPLTSYIFYCQYLSLLNAKMYAWSNILFAKPSHRITTLNLS